MTDGDNNAGKIPPLTAAEAAAAIGIKIYTIGAGTNGLVPFPTLGRFWKHLLLARIYAVQRRHMPGNRSDRRWSFLPSLDTKTLKEIFNQIDQFEKTDLEVQKYQNYQDIFGWLLGAGLCFLGATFVLGETIWSKVP